MDQWFNKTSMHTRYAPHSGNINAAEPTPIGSRRCWRQRKKWSHCLTAPPEIEKMKNEAHWEK
jgi:hypothetical protein